MRTDVLCALGLILIVAVAAMVMLSPPQATRSAESGDVGQGRGDARAAEKPRDPSLCGVAPISCPQLRRWLARSYSETEQRAAFGEYPAENLDVATLHQTRAAIRILLSDVPSQPLPPIATRWIESLRTPDGLYDDPSTSAPLLLETYWALDILAALGMTPARPAEVYQAALSAVPPIDALDASCTAKDLLTALGDGHDAAGCLEALAGRAALAQDLALGPLRVALDRILSIWRLDPAPYAAWTLDDLVAPMAATLLARISGAATSPQARAILVELLAREPEYPAGFLWESDYVALLEASQDAFGWSEAPDDVCSAVASYLERTEPPRHGRGYGSTIDGWSWVDPPLNVCRTQLYKIIGARDPVLPSMLHTMERLSCPDGWSSAECAIPNPDWTYFCTRIAGAIGASGVDWEKVAAYARACLCEPDQGPETLLASVRTLTYLGVLSDADRAAVLAFVDGSRASESGSDRGLEYAAAILDAIDASPSDAMRELLAVRAARLSADLPTLRPSGLLGLARLHKLLGEDVVPADPLRATIAQLAVPSGGYRLNAASPVADLMSTYYCVAACAVLDCLDALDADQTREYVFACWSSYGFQLARPQDAAVIGGVTEPDLVSTYMAFDILDRLDAVPRSP